MKVVHSGEVHGTSVTMIKTLEHRAHARVSVQKRPSVCSCVATSPPPSKRSGIRLAKRKTLMPCGGTHAQRKSQCAPRLQKHIGRWLRLRLGFDEWDDTVT
eukprot:3388978-Pleurochrysis_carterae.AAC.2